MGKEDTKNLLLETGRNVFLERGYTNSGIESILQASGVPKGSFYYYFESKEDFGLQVLELFARIHNDKLERFLADQSQTPLNRLRNYVGAVSCYMQEQQCRKGCLVGNLSLEMADQSEKFRRKLEEIFRSWVDRYATCLSEAQSCGELSPQLDTQQLAEFWLNSWQGALLRAKTIRSTVPLTTFLHCMLSLLNVPTHDG